jgi:hypothetical protein
MDWGPMAYRTDRRSEKQFIEDIKLAHVIELDIAIRICAFEFLKKDKWPHLIAAGMDVSGTFIKDSSSIKNDPDFLIDNEFVDITRSNPFCRKHFHQKKGKVNRAIRDRHNIVFCNGYKKLDPPRFVFITPEVLDLVSTMSEMKYGIVGHPDQNGFELRKQSYRYDTNWFDGMWHDLPPALDEEKLPTEYQQLIGLFKTKCQS